MAIPAENPADGRRVQSVLRRVSLAVASGSDDIFHELIRGAAEALGVDYAFIGESVSGRPDLANMTAFYNRGKFETPFVYDLKPTPCRTVINQTFRYYPSNVQSIFSDPHLKEIGGEGYAAIPLYDTRGAGIGLMGVMHRQPLSDEPLVESVLRILSVRAAIELERRNALQAQRKAEDERARVEAQLRQSQKMEAIGQLTGGIAHDFNNILTGVMGYIVMAQERSLATQDAQSVKYLDRAQRAVQRARDLIQQMLTFSRGQRGSTSPQDVAALARESVRLLESSLPSTVEMHTDFPAGLPEVRLDPVQFEQVLMNLCINARDATNGTGRLGIDLRLHDCPECVCTSCRKTFRGTHVVLTVSDTGTGVPDHLLDRIFEPFYTTKEVGKGSGMGLAMVHGIVHEYGGHVLVESAIGQGTRFRVMFPVTARAPAEAVAASGDSRANPAVTLVGRILLVDDDATAREFMHDRLTDWGLQVTGFDGPEPALRHFESHADEFDAAILDQTMPRMTGLELARRLIVKRPDLPKLLYSGFADTALEGEIKSAGVHATLKKPIDEATLLARLREIL
jgi:signal transduction histidine kinase/CheY-like chemotaxis protein